MLSDPKDTLAFHQSRVFCTQRDMRDVPLKLVSAAIKKYLADQNKSMAVPESEALWFYGMNHAVAMVAQRRAPLEPMAEAERLLVETYHEKCVEKSIRAFYYLMLICTREARHNMSLKKDGAQIKEIFGDQLHNFFCKQGGGEADIQKRLLEVSTDVTVGNYVQCLQWQFYNSSWNGGYGGKAWGQVTDCLVRFVLGEYSAEMMMDTVWMLAHNNGPIFNKGQLYKMYNYNLVRILDIQRSGQVPQAILYDEKVKPFVDVELNGLIGGLKELFPDDVGGYVDWFVVEALGAVHEYPQDKAAQKSKYGMSKSASKAEKEKALKAEAAAVAAAKKKAQEQKDYFPVMPGLKVKKVELKRVA